MQRDSGETGFIDIHAHAYRGDAPAATADVRFATVEEVLARYDEIGIEKGFLLPLIGPEVYLPQSNEDILDMCATSGGRLLPFCNIDPRGMTNSPDAPLDRWIRHYKDRGCLGLGEVMPNLPFLDPRCQNLFRHAEEAEMPLIFDIADRIGETYGFYDDPGLPQLDETLRRFPNLKIFGHGPAFWSEIGKLERIEDRGGYPPYSFVEEGVVPKMFRRHENLYGDLSARSGFNALNRNPAYAASFLDEFQDRLFYGTDICTAHQAIPLPAFLAELRDKGAISENVYRKITRENAKKMFFNRP
jgi:predicted TIM-barrel fold metal-dependent hydrolase